MKKVLLFLLIFSIFSCSKKEKQQPTTQQSGQRSSQVFTLVKIEKSNQSELAPNFSWQTPDGEANFYEIIKDKVVLVNFWATWCGPCVKEIPDLIKIKEELGGKNFEIIGVSIDRSISPVVEFSKNVGINYVLIHDPEAKLLDAFGGSIGIPTTYLVDRNGKIINKYVGSRTKEVFVNDIQKLLK